MNNDPVGADWWYPVTFAADTFDDFGRRAASDNVGVVHQYLSPHSDYRTACGKVLSSDHGVVTIESTKPLCPICWKG